MSTQSETVLTTLAAMLREVIGESWADDLAIALADLGADVGVDLERVEARDESFAATAFTAAERALIQPGDDEAEWLTRLWAAKEAAGKRAGTGLDGNPRKLPITDRTGARLLCAGIWVETRRLGDHVIAWTVHS